MLMVLVLAIVILTAAASGALSDAPRVICSVREAAQAPDQARQFAPAGEGITLEGGFVVSAVPSVVTGGTLVDVRVGDTTGTEREIVIDLQVRANGSYTDIFCTDGYGPRPFANTGTIRYRSGCSIPSLTVYGEDAGVTIAAPFEVPAPSLTLSWAEAEDGAILTATVSNLRLQANGTASAALLVGEHEGCWRPGLGWLYSLYPEYFDPPNPTVWNYDGPMIYTFVTDEERLGHDLMQDLEWQELGWYWPHLGLYLPEAEQWRRQPRSEGGIGEGGDVTRTMLNQYIDLSNRLGVAQCLYFQSTESLNEYAESNFPECRIQRENGDLAPTWVKCVVMDPDPNGRFGTHILQQVEGLMDAYPGMAGVFWDQNCYTGFDFAHDDGISMANGRRVSMMEFPQQRVLELGGKLLHDRDKVIFTNGGWTVGLARYCDGHMSEGMVPTRRMQYLCMNKHLTLLSYDGNLRATREKLCLALETGAQPCVTLGDDPCREFSDGYLPIFRMLRHKRFVAYPRALTLPKGISGGIFTNPTGDYLVTAVASEAPVPLARREDAGSITVRLPDAEEIGAVFGMNPQLRGLQGVDLRRDGQELQIALSRPEAGTAFVLARRGRWIGARTPRLIAGRQQHLHLAIANLSEQPWRGRWRFAAGDQDVTRELDIVAGQTQTITLGPIQVAADASTLPVAVTGPEGDPDATTTIEVPVVAPIGLHVQSDEVIQIPLGQSVEYAIVSRLPEPVTLTRRVSWLGEAEAIETAAETLQPGETRTYTVQVSPPRAGLWELRVDVEAGGQHFGASMQVDAVGRVLPKDFAIAEATGLTLRLDIFNSLDAQWADKPVTVNGIGIGRLPVTGSTRQWHEALAIEVKAETARAVLQAGLQDNGDIVLAVVVGNAVKNCFKVRKLQVTVSTASGAGHLSTTDHGIYCSDPGWLYAEGQCVRLGQPVPVGTARLLRQE